MSRHEEQARALRDALVIGREAMYLTDAYFHHWVHLKAEMLVYETDAAAFFAEGKQQEFMKKYEEITRQHFPEERR